MGRLGRRTALVAVVRKLLIVVWHVLTKSKADRHAVPVKVAQTLFRHVYWFGRCHFPRDQIALAYTRYHLDRLSIGKGTDTPTLGE